MKNKLLFANVILTLTISMTACGQTNNEIEDTASIESIAVAESSIENVSEAESSTIIEDVNDEMTIEAVESSSVTETEMQSDIETIEDETKENESDVDDKNFTEEEALEKVHKLMDAYHDLLASNDETTWNILDRCERYDDVGYIVPKTKDGLELNWTEEELGLGSVASIVMGSNYYYNYVNNDTGYYDFTEYIESHSMDEILYEHMSQNYVQNIREGLISCDKILMSHGLMLIPYMNQFEEITANKFVEGDACTFEAVNETKVYYELYLDLDGQYSGLRALYDANGNMLNVTYTDDTNGLVEELDEYIYTFPEVEE